MPQTLKLEVLYPYPIEQVWHALTDQQILATWMMENDFEPHLGHRFQFQDPTLPGLNTVIDCEVIAIEAPCRLVYTWKDAWMNHPSVVTWQLISVEDGTQLQLHHSGLAHTSTSSVTSPVTHLAEPFRRAPIAQASLHTIEASLANSMLSSQSYPSLGVASLETPFSGNWDYRLKQVLPRVLAERTSRAEQEHFS